MRPKAHLSSARGFALIEFVVCVCVVLTAILICALALPDARRRARLTGSIQNLQQLGAGAQQYAADNDNRIFSFTWTPGAHNCDGYAFPAAASTLDAAADQAVCIIRRLSGRTDIQAIRNWVPHVLFNHLVLVDYLGDTLPSSMLVSPGDAPRLAWQRAARVASENPSDQGAAYFSLLARPAGNDNNSKRWAYSSSYEIPPAFFSPDAQINTPNGPIQTFSQGPTHRTYVVGGSNTPLGNRRMNEILHPSHKVMMFESVQRFFGQRELFFAYAEARIPVIMSDGSASVRSTARANSGFNPSLPHSPTPTRMSYEPEIAWEPPTANGNVAEFVSGMYRWTRSGLRGRDFNGPEIPWAP